MKGFLEPSHPVAELGNGSQFCLHLTFLRACVCSAKPKMFE